MTVRYGYRADIDGLRAVAVLSVVLYHINQAWVPGGYIGVDIFFVISGFLITRNIASELAENHFTIAGFYLRRIRRIAPAFMLVTMVTLATGMIFLLPSDMVRMARSALWSIFSAANIYFWKYLHTGYFAPATEQEPLLHMWSLGVEEQFYLLWPILLLTFNRFRGKRTLFHVAAYVICVGSFYLAEVANIDAPKFSYYMIPTRAGELMIGAIIALSLLSGQGHSPHRDKWRLLPEVISLAGLGLIAYSLWALNESSLFPGVNAIYPCVGAAAVILGGHSGSLTNRLVLTWRPIVSIGLMSYSIYLWHWPILAYLKYFFGEPSTNQIVIAVFLTLILSMASYRLVEQPARKSRLSVRGQVAVFWAVPAACIALVSAVLICSRGMETVIENSAAFQSHSAALERETAPANRGKYPCMDALAPVEAALSDSVCVLGDRGHSRHLPDVFMWGDSNAGHYLGVLDVVAKRGGFNFRYLAMSTCPSIFGGGPYGAIRFRNRCDAFRKSIRTYLRQSTIKIVVLASQWSTHDKQSPSFGADMENTISELRASGKRVVILGQVPSFPRYNKDCPRRWARVGESRCTAAQSDIDLGDWAANVYLKNMAGSMSGVSYLDIRTMLCTDGQCSPYINGVPVYFNTTHLSAAGSELIGETLLNTADGSQWENAFAMSEN